MYTYHSLSHASPRHKTCFELVSAVYLSINYVTPVEMGVAALLTFLSHITRVSIIPANTASVSIFPANTASTTLAKSCHELRFRVILHPYSRLAAVVESECSEERAYSIIDLTCNRSGDLDATWMIGRRSTPVQCCTLGVVGKQQPPDHFLFNRKKTVIDGSGGGGGVCVRACVRACVETNDRLGGFLIQMKNEKNGSTTCLVLVFVAYYTTTTTTTGNDHYR